MESELFGHVKGAFTGAQADRAGAFERAHGGTVFLDEVGELPLEVQPRLLRVLERRQVKRVGGNDYRTVDVRVVAATHVDLEGAVKAGRFRQDLFHRLAVLRVALPPLRERPEDIPLLIDTVLERMGKPPSALSDQTRRLARPVSLARATCASCATWWSGWSTWASPPCPTCEPARARARSGDGALDLDLPFKEAKERLIEGFERDYLTGLSSAVRATSPAPPREAGIDRVYLRKLLRKHGLDENEPE